MRSSRQYDSPMHPDLRLLRYFIAVAEELNFTRAAERLYIAQPSLSAAIRQLERQIGVQLFDRDTRRVVLTAAGHAMLPHARDALAAAERGVDAALAAQGGQLDVLRVVYTMPLEAIATSAIDRLEARNPQPSITARGTWTSELVRELRDGHADIGVLRFPEDAGDLRMHQLRGDPLCALVPADHPLTRANAVGFADLADEPVVVWNSALGMDQYNALVAHAFETAGTPLRAFSTGRLDVPGWLPVARGEAIALVGAAERTPGGTVKITITDAPRMPVFVGWRPSDPPPLMDAIIQAIQAGVDQCCSQPTRSQNSEL